MTIKIMVIRRCVFAIAVFAIMTMTSFRANAHGAVAMENDICKLKVAGYFMHFAGYQPDHSITEFCEDIPMAGRTVIVLDFIDDALRDMAVAAYIVKQEKSGPIDPDSVTLMPAVLNVPARKYPSGTITLNLAFKEPGNYLGVVTVGDRAQYVASFPFSVGVDRTWRSFAIWGAVVIALAFAIFLWAYRQRTLAIAAQTGKGIS
jgi:hypothetical protein